MLSILLPFLSSACPYMFVSVCTRTMHLCVTESPSLLKMLFRNDIFPHDSVAFSGTANQGSGTGMSCRDAARRQAATTVCRLISAPYCHFVKSHYSNENRSRKAMTEQGYEWAVCQRHSDFILSCSLFELGELGLGLGRGGGGCGREAVVSFYCVMCHCQGCSCCLFCFQSRYWLGHISLMNEWRIKQIKFDSAVYCLVVPLVLTLLCKIFSHHKLLIILCIMIPNLITCTWSHQKIIVR